eukprot:g46250.t1
MSCDRRLGRSSACRPCPAAAAERAEAELRTESWNDGSRSSKGRAESRSDGRAESWSDSSKVSMGRAESQSDRWAGYRSNGGAEATIGTMGRPKSRSDSSRGIPSPRATAAGNPKSQCGTWGILSPAA